MSATTFNARHFTEEDVIKLAKYVMEYQPVHIMTNVLKRGKRVIKEVLFECANDKRYVADLNQPEVKFVEYDTLRTVERKVKRSEHGDWAYRGNADSDLFRKAINYIYKKMKKAKIVVADFMEGSGTSRDLCTTLKFVHYIGNDLRYGFDRTKDESPVKVDVEILHPPYFVAKDENTGKLSFMPQYSGVQWGKKGDIHPSDGSHIHNWQDYVKWNNKLIAKAMLNLSIGGRLIYMNAPVKFKGKYYDIFKDMDIYGELEQVIIKEQYNTMSDNVKYQGSFIPIAHEYAIIIKKTSNLQMPCTIVKKKVVNLMKSVKITWKELIQNVVEHLGGVASYEQIFDFLKKYPKSENNNHLKEKIRQISNTFKDIFEKVEKNVVALKSVSDLANSKSNYNNDTSLVGAI